MLKESLKWMILTLAVFAVIITGIVFVVTVTAKNTPTQDDPANTVLNASPDAAANSATPTPTATPAITRTPRPTATPEPTTDAEWVRLYVSRMSLEDKLGQLVMFGFSGTSAPSTAFTNLFAQYHVGNIILYGANIESGNADGGFEQTRKLTARLTETNASEIPLLVSTDVEGGSVVRFRWSPWPSSARTLGRRNDAEEAKEQFSTIGTKLLSVGINMDLAPVLDVTADPMSSFLGTRIISDDAAVTANIGAAIVSGLSESGCLSTAKHFPGHGAADVDSHETTPVIDKTLDELRAYDLVPFQAAIDANVDAILVGHLSFPKIDPDNITTVSRIFLTDILRTEMGFDGVVISDDFRMEGLASRYDVGAAAVQFINAGGDLILCGAQSDKQISIMEALAAAVEDGTLTEERINESVCRILEKKLAVTDFEVRY